MDSNTHNKDYHSQNKTKGNRVVPHFVSQLDNNKTLAITSYRKMEGKMSNLYKQGNSTHSNHYYIFSHFHCDVINDAIKGLLQLNTQT